MSRTIADLATTEQAARLVADLAAMATTAYRYHWRFTGDEVRASERAMAETRAAVADLLEEAFRTADVGASPAPTAEPITAEPESDDDLGPAYVWTDADRAECGYGPLAEPSTTDTPAEDETEPDDGAGFGARWTVFREVPGRDPLDDDSGSYDRGYPVKADALARAADLAAAG